MDNFNPVDAAAADLVEAVLHATDGTLRLDDQTARDVVSLLTDGTEGGNFFEAFHAHMSDNAFAQQEGLGTAPEPSLLAWARSTGRPRPGGDQ